MRRIAVAVMILFVATGCAMKKRSALLLERYTRGVLSESPLAGKAVPWHLEPSTQQQQTQKGIEVSVTYASLDYLRTFFSDRKIFGEFAGQEPYFPENLLFYIKIANRSEKRLRLMTSDVVLVDNRGNQYSPINVDYVTAYAEFRTPVSTMTRGILEEARPGYFGLSLPVGKIIGAKPQGRFALIQQSSILSGYLYPGVVHDGLIAFWNPSVEAKSMRLIISNLKTDFDANDFPQTALDFSFPFKTVTP